MYFFLFFKLNKRDQDGRSKLYKKWKTIIGGLWNEYNFSIAAPTDRCIRWIWCIKLRKIIMHLQLQQLGKQLINSKLNEKFLCMQGPCNGFQLTGWQSVNSMLKLWENLKKLLCNFTKNWWVACHPCLPLLRGPWVCTLKLKQNVLRVGLNPH